MVRSTYLSLLSEPFLSVPCCLNRLLRVSDIQNSLCGNFPEVILYNSGMDDLTLFAMADNGQAKGASMNVGFNSLKNCP